MASLSTEIQNRYGSQFLINITNPQNTAATTIDTTRLNNAITDCAAYFQIYGGTTLDTAAPSAIHLAAAIPTVIELCKVYSGQLSWHTIEESVKNRIEAMSQIDARNRISPTTDSLKVKTADVNGEHVVFDVSNFKGLIPGAPRGSSAGATDDSRDGAL